MELMADAFMIGLEKFLKYTGWKYDIKTADESNDEATTELLDGMIEAKI